MQDLLFQLLWGNTDISRKAHALALAAPGYEAAFQTYQAAHQKLQALVGFDALDDYDVAFSRLHCYQNDAYYALGLGLRQELAKLWVGK